MKFLSFKTLYKAHVYGGVFVAAHFLVLSLTGCVLLFKDDLQSLGGASKPQASAQHVDPASYLRIFEQESARYPSDRPLSIFPDEGRAGAVNFRLGKNGAREFRGARKLTLDGASGQDISGEVQDTGFFAFVLELHRELFLGTYGKLYVGVVGLVIAFVLVSGFLIYGNFMRNRRYGEVRAAPSSLRATDHHKLLGATTFAWTLLVTVTGVFLAFNSTLIKLHQKRSLGYLADKYASSTANGPQAPIDRVIETALEARPGTQFSFLAFPDTEFSIPGHFLVLVNGTSPLTEKISELVVIEAQGARLVEVVGLPWYLKFVMLSEPLHFGDYGGLPLKALWLVLSLLASALAALGLGSFVLKRSRKKAQVSSPARPASGQSVAATAWAYRSRYAIPAASGVCAAAGVGLSLLTEGWLDWLAYGLLSVPFAALVVASVRRRRLAYE